MCFGATESSGSKIPPTDIQDLESVGFAATPNQYYRQYAAGKIDGRDAIFINGFHESYLPSGDPMRWRSDVVLVSDGGEIFWCAVYVQSLKQHFVTYKDPRLGGVTRMSAFMDLGEGPFIVPHCGRSRPRAAGLGPSKNIVHNATSRRFTEDV